MENAAAELGSVLAGKYRIERILGQGGMGIVAAAMHLQLEELVAIKFLLPEALESTEIIARFNREARAAAKIKSEHVARVIDVGELESGAPYIVMEYLEGADLQQRLEKGGPLPVTEAVDKLLQACEALAEAHALGIVHRDLKPANLFVSKRADSSDCVKLLDFGVSKSSLMSPSDQKNLTQTASVIGSPYYMSPEQLTSSKDVDGRADIWSLGVILYELITGVVPFEADSIGQLVLSIMQTEPPSLLERCPTAPPGLAEVLGRCLAKDRLGRYDNVAELARDLGPFGTALAQVSVDRIGRVMGSPAAALATADADVEADESLSNTGPLAGTQGAWGLTRGDKRARGLKSIAAAVVAAAVIGGIVLAFVGGGSEAEEAGAPRLAGPSPEPPASTQRAGSSLPSPSQQDSKLAPAKELPAPATQPESPATPVAAGTPDASAAVAVADDDSKDKAKEPTPETVVDSKAKATKKQSAKSAKVGSGSRAKKEKRPPAAKKAAPVPTQAKPSKTAAPVPPKAKTKKVEARKPEVDLYGDRE